MSGHRRKRLAGLVARRILIFALLAMVLQVAMVFARYWLDDEELGHILVERETEAIAASVHRVAGALALAGAKYAEVSAQTAFQSGREHEDMVTISAKLQNGTIVNHLVNWLTPFKERLTLVTGERGAFVADTLTADLTFYENGTFTSEWDAVTTFRGVSEGTVTRFALDKREPLRSEHEAFRDRILGKPSEAVTLREGLEVLRVCEASLESSQTSKTVRLGEFGE